MPTKCQSCGAETSTPELFFKERRSFRRHLVTYCPGCWQKRSVSTYRKILLWQSMLGLTGLLIILVFPEEEVGWIFINFFVFQLFSISAILPHEFAHAWAAKAMGLRVFKVIIGSGKTLFTKKIFGFSTEFKAVPMGGLAIAAHRDADYFRAKQFGFVLAGPFVNLLLAALAYPFVADELWSMRALEQGLAAGPMFFYANLAVLIENLWPHCVTTSLGKLPSDGKLLLQTLRMKPEEIEQQLVVRFVFEAAEAFELKDYETARNAVDQGLRRHPGDFYLLNWLGLLLIRFRELSEARDVFVEILAESEKLPSHHAMILNNVAYLDAIMGRPELLPEANDYSEKAMNVLSWHPAIKGTRGTVLVALGRIEEGIALLKQSMADHDNVQGKAENACYLAMAEAKRGDFAASQQYIAEARRYDSTCYMLEMAEACMKTSA